MTNGLTRRKLIVLSGAVATWPPVARAQPSEQVRRIGVLTSLSENDPEQKAWLRAFQEALQRLGWEQDRNLRIEYPSAGGDQHQLLSGATELGGLAPDVLFASGTPALVALNQETRSLPIVFVQVSDPVRLGFVASLARPGGNITGFANFEHAIGGKWLELLKDTAPERNRVAVIFEGTNPSQIPSIASEIQFVQTFSAAVVAGSGEIEYSKRLIEFLASARASEAIRKSGMESLATSR